MALFCLALAIPAYSPKPCLEKTHFSSLPELRRTATRLHHLSRNVTAMKQELGRARLHNLTLALLQRRPDEREMM